MSSGKSNSSSKVSIEVSTQLYLKMQELMQRYGYSNIEDLLTRAIILLESVHRRGFKIVKQSEVDRCAWYVYKFSRSVSEFVLEPSDRNIRYLEQRIRELKDRLGIESLELDILIETAKELLILVKNGSTEREKTYLKIEINDIAKSIIAQIMIKMLSETNDT